MSVTRQAKVLLAVKLQLLSRLRVYAGKERENAAVITAGVMCARQSACGGEARREHDPDESESGYFGGGGDGAAQGVGTEDTPVLSEVPVR